MQLVCGLRARAWLASSAIAALPWRLRADCHCVAPLARSGTRPASRSLHSPFLLLLLPSVTLATVVAMSGLGEAFTSNWKAMVAEVTGSCFLVFCGSLMIGEARPDILDDFRKARAFVYLGDVGLRFGMALATLAVAIGPVSGAHFNPVVSMAALINGRIEWQPCLFYVLAQLGGSVAGAFIAWCFGGSGLTLPSAMHSAETKALVMEILITMLLVLVFLGATDPDRGDALKDLAGIAVGLALAVGHWVGIPFSGGSMNPFRSLASALTENHWSNIWIYFVGPIVGSAISALLYRFVFSGAKEGASL